MTRIHVYIVDYINDISMWLYGDLYAWLGVHNPIWFSYMIGIDGCVYIYHEVHVGFWHMLDTWIV